MPPPPSSAPSAAGGSVRAIRLGALVLAVAVILTYARSWSVPFFFDDLPAIVDNPTLRDPGRLDRVLVPPDDGSAVTGRPLVNATFALNYALGGLDPTGYHAGNLLLHLAATLALYGLARRLLLTPALAPRWGGAALPLAGAIALLWGVHPLQSESVVCVVQRTELLVGALYLFLLYAVVRGAQEPARAGRWHAAAIAAAWLGMAAKEVMVTAPVVALLLDRTFLAGTFRGAWRARRGLYLGLASAWLLLGALLLTMGGTRGGAAGLGLGVTPWSYLLTQAGALVRYLGLAVWPHPLVVDYGTAVAAGLGAVLPAALAIVALLGLTGWLAVRRPAAGFLGLWFFLILAPSPSVVPLVAQTVAEHRMYLPLAAVVAALVLAFHALAPRAVLPVAAAAAVALGAVTLRRQADYRDPLTLWTVTCAQVPANPRAHHNLGQALLAADRPDDARARFARAVALQPGYTAAEHNLATTLVLLGRLPEAIATWRQLLASAPDDGEAHSGLCLALARTGDLPAALAHGRAATARLPASADAHLNLANALGAAAQPAAAAEEFAAALHLNPDLGPAHLGLGHVLLDLGRRDEALRAFATAVRLMPGFAPAAQALHAAQTAAK